MMKLKKEKPLIIVAFLALLIIVIGATYAFFQAQKGTGGNAQMEVGAGTTDSLTFHVGTPIDIKASADDFYQGANDKSGSTSATAKLVPNNNTNHAEDKYNVYFIIDANDFVYSTDDKQVELLLKVKNPNHDEVQSIDGLIYREDLQGFDITERHGAFKITVDDDIEASSQEGTEETWEFEVILRNLEIDQQANTGKTFEGKVLITTEEKETYVMPEINSITEASKDYESITVNLLENEKHTEAIDKYYYAIEETDEEPETIRLMSIAEKLEPEFVESDEPTHIFRELNGEPLKDNQSYKVYAYSKDIQGIISNIKTAVVKTDEYQKVKVTGFTVTERTLTNIKVSATAEAGTKNVKEYAFKIENHDTYGNWSAWQVSSEYNFTGLADTSTYKIQIKVRDELDRESVDSFDRDEKTLDYVYGSVKTFTVSDITSSVIKVNGTFTNGTGTVSKVEYQRNGDTNWYQGTNSNGTYSYSFTGLTKATAYTFKVRVTDNNNRSKVYENASYKGTTLNNYLVKATVSGGTATPTQATVDHGKSTTFAIAATTGYNLSKATVEGTGCSLSTDKKTLTASNVTAATTCAVTIPKLEYNVTVSITGGTVDSSPKVVKYDEKVTFTITATTGYNLSAATVKGTGCSLSTDKKTLTASNIKAATTCTVTIPKYEYNVTVNITGGTVDSSPKKVKYNESGTFTITATTGYNLSAATVSGTNCTLSSDKKTLTASKVTAARTCTVTIPKYEYNVTVTVTNGKVDSSPKKVKYNESTTFTISANSGYDLASAAVSGSNCTFSADKKTLTASKVTAARTCTVTIYKTQTLSSYVISKVGTSGSGTLAQHITSLTNSAKDNSYRYSGNNPNNFVCFGSGSETYNNGGTTCPDTNLYRIIGVFNNQVKLIKSEYIKSTELGIASNGTPGKGSYDSLKRVKVAPADGFKWNQTANNTWSTSTLYQALNKGYLTFLGTTWTNKIATTTWHVGGHSTSSATPKVMYDAEIKSTPTVSAQIGLMYASDYGFASASSSWTSTLYSYDNTGNSNRENNWLFNNIFEWTISHNSSDSNNAFCVRNGGYVNYNGVNGIAYGVRPSFYLNTNVNVVVDTAKDGSVSKPFKIVL